MQHEDKLSKLKEIMTLRDEKSLLLADKIDKSCEMICEKMDKKETERKEDMVELTQAIKDIPPVPEPIDHTEKIEEMMSCIEEMKAKMDEETEIILEII